MKKMLYYLIAAAASFYITTNVYADTRDGELIRVQSHRGQMDTDGILSQGELKNPNINYDKAQRDYERRGDYRVENRYNDAAAWSDRRWGYSRSPHWYYDSEESRRDRERAEREWRERHDRWSKYEYSEPWWLR